MEMNDNNEVVNVQSMNIHQKISILRERVDVKKTGRNKHGNYDYYELSEIYFKSKAHLKSLGLNTEYSQVFLRDGIITRYVNKEYLEQKVDWFRGTLTVINCDKPDEKSIYILDIPYSELAGCQPAQSQGGTKSYCEKYCWQSFLLLDDDVDGDSQNKHETDGKADDGNTDPPKDDKKWLPDKDYERLMRSGAIDEIKTALKDFKMKKDYRTALDGRIKELQIKRAADGVLKPKVNPVQLKTRLDSNDPVKIQALLDKADLTPQQTEEVKAYLKKLSEATTTVEDDLPI